MVQSINDKRVEELSTQLANKDKDIARIREQRDQYWSDLTECRQKISVKLSSLHEFKSLAESRAVCLNYASRGFDLTMLHSNISSDFIWKSNASKHV